jgi:hypothetical protein
MLTLWMGPNSLLLECIAHFSLIRATNNDACEQEWSSFRPVTPNPIVLNDHPIRDMPAGRHSCLKASQMTCTPVGYVSVADCVAIM